MTQITTTRPAIAEHPANADPAENGWMLVGVDGTEASSVALRWAVSQRERFGRAVPATAWRHPVATGWSPHGAPVRWPASGFIDHAKHRAASVLRVAGQEDAGKHLVAEKAPGPMLVENSAGARLVVVGCRGRGPVSSSVLGSVSGYCIANSSVPVAVVPSIHRRATQGRVIVGLDDSPEAFAALDWALHNTPKDHRVHVIHVAHERDDAALWLRYVVARVAATVGDDAPIATSRVVYGPPAHMLRLASSGADMLVVGARGRGRVAHALLGSVATSLCRDPAAVTVVVPTPPENHS